jgi:hypothetical protein
MMTVDVMVVVVIIIITIIIIVVVVTNLCIQRSIELKIYATGRYALCVVLGTACFSQSLVRRLTWSE